MRLFGNVAGRSLLVVVMLLGGAGGIFADTHHDANNFALHPPPTSHSPTSALAEGIRAPCEQTAPSLVGGATILARRAHCQVPSLR